MMGVVKLSEADLVAQLVGALDPGDAAWVLARAGAEDHLRASGLAAWAGVPGAAAPRLRATAGAGDDLRAAEDLAVGDRLTVALPWEGPLDAARCAVFRDAGGVEARLWPAPGPWPALSRFRQRDGVPVADLVLGPPAGVQRFTFVLVHAALAEDAWPDADARWARLLAAYRAGTLVGCEVELTLSSP